MIISGKELSVKLKDEMKAQVATFPEKYGRVPHLVVILVGEDPGSVSYVTGKAKASEYVGIRNTTIRKPDTISEAELLGIIEELNADDTVDGILVQLPLPKHISEDKVIATISIISLPARSAIVRATRKMRSYPRAESPRRSNAFFSICAAFSLILQYFCICRGESSALQ